MVLGKRSRSTRYRSARKAKYLNIRQAIDRTRALAPSTVARTMRRLNRIATGVRRLNRMVETKETGFRFVNVDYNHNSVSVITWSGGYTNPFERYTGADANRVMDDESSPNRMRVVGDECNIRGMSAKFFLENTLGRPKTYYRIMLLKGPRGAAFTDCFTGMATNKMIDQVKTEKYTIIAQKIITVQASNANANVAQALTGAPVDNDYVTGGRPGGIASKIVKFWIPGKRFGRGGNIQYENDSSTLKFYDYRWVICVYDWYGTPETGLVGKVNEAVMRIYYKDA